MRTMAENTQIFPIVGNNVFESKIEIERLFDAAIGFANQGLKTKAIDTAREALIFAKQRNEYIMVYIHSFLASMSLDTMKSVHARIHCYNALSRLDKNHYDYKTDKQYLETLLIYIDKAEDKINKMEFEAIAA